MLEIYIDGASAGNPGKAGIGFLIYKNGSIIKKESIYLGIQSNNFAEYMALIFSLIEVLSLGEKDIRILSDSKLVCEQINGKFKVKNQNIKPLHVLAKNIISKLDNFSIDYISREKNEEADKLAKKAISFLI